MLTFFGGFFDLGLFWMFRVAILVFLGLCGIWINVFRCFRIWIMRGCDGFVVCCLLAVVSVWWVAWYCVRGFLF